MNDGFNPRWQGARTEEELRRQHKNLDETVVLEQVPHPQTAIFTADHHSDYVLGLVGGYDFNRSEYNRAVQACRQPGSTYKPIYYSAALDAGYGFDTLLEDKPIEVVDPVTGEIWSPTNFGGAMDNQVTLEYALVFSKNLPSVGIFSKLGAKNVEKWARRLGFTTTIIADKALALGASCTVLPELTGAFAVFARQGRRTDWVYVRRVFDREGALLEDHTVPFDPMLPPADRLDRIAATAGVEAEQAISPRTAYLTTKLLSQTIKHGFSSILRATGIHAAGKTGTSSATMDTAFVAFTSRWITTVWMGDDVRERPLGKDDAAYMTVEPMWARYMAELTAEHPNQEIPWLRPEGVSAKDRGDHDLGERGSSSDLVYKRAPRPDELPPPGDG
jgi:penicillin-binding protein 1A